MVICMSDGKHRRNLDPVSVLGELFLTFGVFALLFAFYDVYWTNVESGRQQSVVAGELDSQWDDRNPRPLTEVMEGAAFARMHIPAFGSDFNYAVVKGTSDADLNKGPGHYTDSQMPGAKGNFAMAGHRVGRGAPFNDLGLLKTCDAVVVEIAGSWNIYRILPIDVPENEREQAASECMSPDLSHQMASGPYASIQGRHITVPSDVSVINPIPGQMETKVAQDDASLLTMTTCHPQYSNAERMIVHAVLVKKEPKRPGYLPKELQE